MPKLKIIITLLLLAYSCTTISSGEVIKIGVLAKRGIGITHLRWTGLAFYLNAQFDHLKFVIVPLTFEEVEPAVETRQIDFLLTNPGMFVNLSFVHHLYAVVTLKAKVLDNSITEFGSVVFTTSNRTGISNVTDIKNQRVAAVNEQSFGGWIAAYRELDLLGISINSFSSLDFLGTHDEVVYALGRGEADIGIVRTGTLELMASEGKIDLADYKSLHLADHSAASDDDYKNFPLMHSSRLYPEWPLIGLPHLSRTIAEQVSSKLLTMPADSEAARQAHITGWTLPSNYRQVDLAFSQLKIGIYHELTSDSFIDVIVLYWKYILSVFIALVILLVNTIYIITLNRKLKSSQLKLEQLATHDVLTGLPNRTLFATIANQYLEIAKREQREAIVMFLDLDRFKQVNDTHGHGAGDVLLQEVSKRISNTLRNNDIVARIGGDEFVVMLWNIDSVEKAEEVLKRLIAAIALPVVTGHHKQIDIGCSIGACSYPKDGEQLDELIKKADISLYEAKERGRGTYVWYSSQLAADQA